MADVAPRDWRKRRHDRHTEIRTEAIPAHLAAVIEQLKLTVTEQGQRIAQLEHHLSTHTHETIRSAA